MNNMQQFAINMIANNPRLQQRAQGNPMLMQGLRAIQNGDANAGQQLAQNICNSMGVSPQQATQQAMQFFGGLGGK